jgi:hypothetical protein
MRSTVLVAGAAVLALAGCGTSASSPIPDAEWLASLTAGATTSEFSYVIDPSLRPHSPTIQSKAGPVPVLVYADAQGIASEFTAGEVVVAASSPADLSAFLARTGGVVVSSNAVPDAPPERRITIPPAYKLPTRYLVRVDASAYPLGGLASDGARRGMTGTYRFSSDLAARTLALVSRERLLGTRLGLNFVAYGDEILHRTEERPLAPNVFDNAFSYTPFKTQQPAFLGNRSTVAEAWQFLAGRGPQQGVRVAIIDSGFWLDADGHPFDNPMGPRTDLPFSPMQYDFNDEDYTAGGMNLNTCTGGNPCPWHGNASASVATGFLDNQGAVAGTGGQVADPILFNIQLTSYYQDWALRTAIAWEADVISMSYGGNCNADCQSQHEDYGLYDDYADAQAAGIVLVASAGNSTEDVDAVHKEPCVVSGIICVGALANDSNQAIDYSNYGSSVDIWAPTNVPAMANGSTWPNLATAGGTSASAPFIAGIAAMLKSIDGSLTSSGVRNLLLSTRHQPDSPDPKVTAYVDAMRAVQEAAANTIPADAAEPNDSAGQATALGAGTTPERRISTQGDQDHYRFTLADYSEVTIQMEQMMGLGMLGLTVTPESAPGVPSGVSKAAQAQGQTYTAKLASPGTYLVKVHTFWTAQPYRLTFSPVWKGLQPDQFEVNDTFATAATPEDGGYEVNLHVASDVDWYVLDNSDGSALIGFAFQIHAADMPVTVTVYDEFGNWLQTHGAATKHDLDFGYGAGKWVVKVSAAERGRYSFSAGQYKYDPCQGFRCLAYDRWWWLDPLGPVAHWLFEDRVGRVFEMREGMRQLTLRGAGIHARIHTADEAQELVVEGRAFDDGGGGVGEALDLGRLRPGTQYLLALERTDAGAPEAPGLVGSKEFQLAFEGLER